MLRYYILPLTQILALFIVAIGFGLRLCTLAGESLWYDELLQLDIAQGSLGMIFPRLRGHSATPLDYLISYGWILLGRSDGWVRVPAVMVGTVTLPVAYQFGRWLLGRRVGLVLMALLAIAPFHIRYSQEARPYALVVLGVTLIGYGFWRLYQTGRWRFFAPLQAGVLISLLAHIFAATIFIALAIFTLLDFLLDRNWRRTIQLVGSLILSGLMPLLIFLAMGWGDVLFHTSTGFGEALVRPEQFTENIEVADQIPGPTVGWPFIQDDIFAPFAASNAAIPLIFLNGLVCAGFVYLITQKRARLVLLLSLWLIVPPVLIIIFLIYRDTFFAPRYIISIMPVYLLLLSAGISSWPDWFKGHKVAQSLPVILIGLVCLNYAIGLHRYYRDTGKENWHLVGDFIATNIGPNDAVIAFRAEPTMNWYYPPTWTAPNFYVKLEDIQVAVAQAERSFVILSIFSSGADAKVKAWLSEQQAIRLVLDPAIHVYYLGNNVPPDQLLAEIQGFALPVDHALYASLARENRRRPEVARQYYRLAIDAAPDEVTRAEYAAALQSLRR
jgi:uncharacterized membrane protein